MTVLLCFLAALCEGFDIQSAGVAAGGVSHEFAPSAAALGWMFSANGAGLLCGAMIGGSLSDRIGRKCVFTGSLAAFGICSLLTALAPSMSWLTAARFLTGMGLGGAMPMLVAVVADHVPPRFRSSSVTFAYAGMPFGAVAASLFVYFWPAQSWRAVFVVGGLAPLAVVPLLMRHLPTTPRMADARTPIGGSTARVRELFIRPRIGTTLVLWAAFFLIALTLHLMLNWLPLLLVGRGLLRGQAALAQACFNVLGALIALIVGLSLDRSWRRGAVLVTLVALPVALLAIAASPPRPLLLIALAAFLGGGVVAEQAILYAVASLCYPQSIRGTGMGAAVAAGRIGSLAGPLFAAWLLGAGRSASQVLIGAIPIVVVCALCVLWLSWREIRA